MTYIVYKLTSNTSGKSYVGITKNVLKRMEHHRSKQSRCLALKNAINKYGWEDFEQQTLATVDTAEAASILEAHYVTSLNTQTPNGYNIREGGRYYVMSDSTREKISAALRGKSRKPLTEEHKQKLSAMKLGKRLSKDRVDALRSMRTGRRWITDGVTNRAVPKTDNIPEGWRLGRTLKPPR